MFWMRFKAYASMKEFLPALQTGGEMDLPQDESTVLDPQIDQQAIAAKKRNGMAMAALTMTFTTPSAMVLVHKATSSEWPGG